MSGVVLDASAAVELLLDSTGSATWVAERLLESQVSTAAILPAEVASALRRAEHTGAIGPHEAVGALRDCLDLPLTMVPFEPLAARIWELRPSITCYDAWYVALAEELSVPLLTLDRRLSRAPGIRCPVLLPPD